MEISVLVLLLLVSVVCLVRYIAMAVSTCRKKMIVVKDTTGKTTLIERAKEYAPPPMCVGWILRQPKNDRKQLEWLPVYEGDDPNEVWEALMNTYAPFGRIVLPADEHPTGRKL